MDRTEFFLADGSINMNRAEIAARRARAEATKVGLGGIGRLFRRQVPAGSDVRR